MIAEIDDALAALNAMTSDIESSNAKIIKSQIALDRAALYLNYTKISAPMDGVIVAIPVDDGRSQNF